MLKVLASIALLMVAAIAGLLAVISDGAIVDHTIENSRTILSQFQKADSLGISQTGDAAYQVFAAAIDDAQCDKTEFQRERKSAGDKELLMVWRGEWMECYSPVSKTSTLTFDRSSYTMFGSFIADRVFYAAVSAFSLCGALYLLVKQSKSWFNRQSKSQPTP
jgi:hypothetical protein